MEKIVFNADDYGLSSNVNNAIYDLLNKNFINRTTIIVNLPLSQKAANQLNSDYYLKNKIERIVGLHLNLSDGVPLTNDILNTDLCKDGRFNATQCKKKYMFFIPKKLKNAVANELDAQFCRFFSLFGFYPKHIDSHGHFHNYLSYFFIIKKIAKKYNVESLRVPIYTSNKFSLKKIYKFFLYLIIKSNFKCTNYVCNIENFEMIKNKKNKYFEIMLHPTYFNGNIYDIISKEIMVDLTNVIRKIRNGE